MPENARKTLITLSVSALVFLACTVAMVFFIDPFKASGLIMGLFYISIFAFCFNFFAAVLFLFWKGKGEMLHYQRVRVSVREGALLAVLFVGSLLISSMGLLYWWVGALFIITIVLIEAFYLI